MTAPAPPPQPSDEMARLIANLAHELRTPLNAIIGFADLLGEEQVGPLDAQQKDFIGTIAASGRGLLAMINDILDLARLQAGTVDLRPAPVDLEEVMRSAIRGLRHQAEEKRLTVDTMVDPVLRDGVVADAGRLRQALRTFLANAIKLTPQGSKIAVRALTETETSLRLEVEDLGAAVGRSDLRRLFESGGPEKRPGEVELGLALTRALVEALGGRVEICGTLSEGSIFSAVLPRADTRPE